jgi:hypothetical protein
MIQKHSLFFLSLHLGGRGEGGPPFPPEGGGSPLQKTWPKEGDVKWGEKSAYKIFPRLKL